MFGIVLLGISFLSMEGMAHESSPQQQSSVFRFASYYQDNMVLQAVPHRAVLWGYGKIGARVEVALNVYETYTTVVNDVVNGTGVWSITFKPQLPGTRGVVSASHSSGGALHTRFIFNIVFGDVWVCGGQSNMVFPLTHVFNSSEVLKNVSKYQDIRIFTAGQVLSQTPLYDLESIEQKWAVPSAETAQHFSAVCWLTAQNIYDKMKIPMGLISSNWGGTSVETWSSSRALSSCGLDVDNNVVLSSLHDDRPLIYSADDPPPRANSVLWNAMIHPLLNMTIRGAIWYQGEQNSGYHRDLYNCTFPAMIKDWRKSWFEAGALTDPQFHFGFVQLCNVAEKKENGRYPLIRWHQTADHGFVPNPSMPNTFMAVILDLPDLDSPWGSVHPRDKQDVGLRLSSEALKYVYKVQMSDDGPFPASATLKGSDVIIMYPQPNLKVLDITNFEICCVESRCDVSDLSPEGFAEWLPASIIYYDMQSVTLSAENCSLVKKVRYLWATTPCKFKRCPIYDLQDFPAPPFVMDVMSK